MKTENTMNKMINSLNKELVKWLRRSRNVGEGDHSEYVLCRENIATLQGQIAILKWVIMEN